MNDDRALRPEVAAPLADVGKPSRLLQRGLNRLEAADGHLVPTSTLWTPVIIWDPEWLNLIHDAPESPTALRDVFGEAQSINGSGQVEGLIHSKHFGRPSDIYAKDGSYRFAWDLNTSSGTLTDVTDLLAGRGQTIPDPYIRCSNENGISVGHASYDDPVPTGEVRYMFDRCSACIVEESGLVTLLPSLGGRQSIAHAVNTALDVVGWSETADHEITKAVRWRGNRLQILLSPFLDSGALGINSAGQIIGWGNEPESDEPPTRATQWGLLWDGDDEPVILRGVPEFISEDGCIVATETQAFDYGPENRMPASDWHERGFVWSKGTVTYLPIPEPYVGSQVGSVPGWNPWARQLLSASASVMNDRGDIAGSVLAASYYERKNATKYWRNYFGQRKTHTKTLGTHTNVAYRRHPVPSPSMFRVSGSGVELDTWASVPWYPLREEFL